MNFTLHTSYTFDLVKGDKLTKVGEYTITLNDDETFTITFNDQMSAVGAKLSISNNIQGFKNKNDKGFDPSYIWTTSPGQQQFGFGGSSYTFSAPWVTDLSKVNVYLHLDGLSGYENTYGVPVGATFDVRVMGPGCPSGTVVNVPVNGSVTIKNLIPGKYFVQEIQSGWKSTYSVNGGSFANVHSVTITINKNATTKVELKNE